MIEDIEACHGVTDSKKIYEDFIIIHSFVITVGDSVGILYKQQSFVGDTVLQYNYMRNTK
jgi:hypothetical protein